MRVVCPDCSTILSLNAAVSDTGQVLIHQPRVGDLSICSGCLKPLRMVEGGKAEILNDEELDALPETEQRMIESAMIVVALTKRKLAWEAAQDVDRPRV